MATDALNAITELPRMTFRGITSPPYDIASFSGSFTLAKRSYPYIDADSYENIGRDSIPMKFRLYFLNSLGEELFPELFEKWVAAVVRDGSAATLEHPLLGDIHAVPQSWSVQLAANQTSGIIMDVNFIEWLEDPSSATKIAIDVEFPVLRQAAEAVDQDYSSLNLPWPTGARTDSLLSLVDQIEGSVFSARLTALGAINQAVGFIGNLIDSVDNIATNPTWPVQSNLLTVWNGMKDLADKVGASGEREVAEETFSYDASIDSIAQELQNTVGEIMTLNTSLLGQPLVPRGTPVKYFRS